jgi:hypothetical protein
LAAYHIGGDTFAKVNAAFVESQKSKRSVLEAAAGDIATTDTPGLLPIPVLGPVFQDINYIRPFISAIGARAYPDGGTSKTFIRPTITTHTSPWCTHDSPRTRSQAGTELSRCDSCRTTVKSTP